MRKIKITCDICQQDVNPKERDISVNGSIVKSTRKTFNRIILRDVSEIDNCTEEEQSWDLCSKCYSEVIFKLLERKELKNEANQQN